MNSIPAASAQLALARTLPRAVRAILSQPSLGTKETFRSTVKLPKGCNRHLVTKAIDQLVFQHLPETEVLEGKGYLRSEKEYVLAVVAEFRAWDCESEKAAVKAAMTSNPSEEG